MAIRRPPEWILPVLTITLVASVTSCSNGSATLTEEWHEERSTEGAVTTVQTLSGSKWGGKARLIQESSIGAASGEEYELFGKISAFALTSSRIYVLDRSVPIVRVYDRSGAHVTDIGRGGQGPGEFLAPMALSISEETGMLFVRDDRMHRIQVFELEGAFLESRNTNVPLMTSERMVVSEEGIVYTTVVIRPGIVDPWRGLLGFGPSGTVGDIIRQPIYEDEPERLAAVDENGVPFLSRPVPFAPHGAWTVTRFLDVVSGQGKEYRIRVDHPDSTTTLIVRATNAVPVTASEADWYRRRTKAEMGMEQPGWVWNGPPIPDGKPFIDRLFTDDLGQIWNVRLGPGQPHTPCADAPDDVGDWGDEPCWTDSWIVDVFTRGGTYLGEVSLPEDISIFPLPVVRGDSVLAAATDAAGVPYVRLYRLAFPGS